MTLYMRPFKNQEADSVRAIANAYSAPFRQAYLQGRACVHSLSDRLARQ